MSFNGSGVFVINSAGQPVVASTLITVAAFNALTADLATGLSTCILKDGTQTVTANIPFNANKLTGVADGSALQDAATLKNIQNGTGVYVATVGGTADVITLTPSPAITAYAAGQTFRFIASGANTTNVTVAISGLAAKAITKNGTTALVAGDIPSGMMVAITYDGTRFILASVYPYAILDTAGDIIYATADNTPAKLAIGTARQMLQVNAGATAPAWANPITLATEQASTSGTSIDFTGIPAGVRRITVLFNEVSTNGADGMCIQLGDAGGIETTGYMSACDSTVPATAAATASFQLQPGSVAAGTFSGVVMLVLMNSTTNTWCASGILARTDSAILYRSTGRKATSAVLDQIRITTVLGINTFDAGAINIAYE